jgi:hypothetical protein
MRLRAFCCFLIVTSLTAAALAQRGNSTEAERQRYLKLVRALEQSPLTADADHKEREWALKWLIDVPDIHVSICGGPVMTALAESKKRVAHQLFEQFTLSMGAYAIEHPEPGPESVEQQQAGLDGMLKFYEAWLKQHPNDHIRAVDEALQKKQSGHLADAGALEAANCGQAKRSASLRLPAGTR